MTSIEVIEAPEPVLTADDLLYHLDTNYDPEDVTNPVPAMLEKWIETATDLWVKTTGHVPAPCKLRLALDNWPCGRVIYLPRYPVTDIESVTYLSAPNTWLTFSGWTEDLLTGRIYTTSDRPTPYADGVPRVRVTFEAGEENDTATTAIKLLVSHWYENRSNSSDVLLRPLPMGWENLTAQYRATHICPAWNERGEHASW